MTVINSSVSRKDLSFIRSALRTAANSSGIERFRLGAVAVKSGRVLSFGSNSSRNKPSEWLPREAWSTHAEEACLRRMPSGSEGATLYVARVGRSGKPLLSKPCDMCMEIAREYGVSRIVFTTGNTVESLYLD